MRTLKIGLDCDEVLFNCIDYALEYAASCVGEFFLKENIADYQMSNVPPNVKNIMYKAFKTPSFYTFQPIFTDAVKMVNQLHSEGHDIIFASAVPPTCMAERAKRLKEIFPYVPDENIMLGGRKDLLDLDVLLDDCAENIKKSIAQKPILFTQPWNKKEKGLSRVSSYTEFLNLVSHIADI